MRCRPPTDLSQLLRLICHAPADEGRLETSASSLAEVLRVPGVGDSKLRMSDEEVLEILSAV